MGYCPSVRSRWLHIGQVILCVYGPGWSRGPDKHALKEQGQYPAILTKQASKVNIKAF